MRSATGFVLIGLGSICVAVFGVWGLVLDVRIVNEIGGVWGAIVALVLFPVTFIVVPWYAVAVSGDWTLVLVSYGGGLLGLGILGAGAAVSVSQLSTASTFGKPSRKFFGFGR